MTTIVPGLVYQRGQILTWPREKKRDLLAGLDVRWVVNFWPKLDPDLSDFNLHGYLYMPLPESAAVVNGYVARMARNLAAELEFNSTALILCEAGKTRSVFFSVLLAREIHKLTGPEALEYVRTSTPTAGLKPAMVRHLEGLGRP